jgi:hypothetical protein
MLISGFLFTLGVIVALATVWLLWRFWVHLIAGLWLLISGAMVFGGLYGLWEEHGNRRGQWIAGAFAVGGMFAFEALKTCWRHYTEMREARAWAAL